MINALQKLLYSTEYFMAFQHVFKGWQVKAAQGMRIDEYRRDVQIINKYS